ncbi:hypothetical protein BC939DRAFT_1692 [Gamsiella multidivaricata]|uniref:uncharacterized protein n=1 Tax=Gamsiella multidivaricata TaxID=101098 RepID=UPI002220F201|nr:uncharacterized protein BC939DRAFT_1692 [Gamsiella multidivaricata]KAI7832594.1 hypothetical protein BC939DRAFT_1692 [Gamsiella multidivaricata]
MIWLEEYQNAPKRMRKGEGKCNSLSLFPAVSVPVPEQRERKPLLFSSFWCTVETSLSTTKRTSSWDPFFLCMHQRPFHSTKADNHQLWTCLLITLILPSPLFSSLFFPSPLFSFLLCLFFTFYLSFPSLFLSCPPPFAGHSPSLSLKRAPDWSSFFF